VSILYYFHTLRYLTLKQILYQILRRIYKPHIRSVDIIPDKSPISSKFCMPIEKDISIINYGEFVFYGEFGNLKDIGWEGSRKEKLWRYNQHYFDDLNAKNASRRKNIHIKHFNNWILNCSNSRNFGWDPYPLSLRIVNWIKWDIKNSYFSETLQNSLYNQCRSLEQKIEYHISGNHVFANAKALIFAGCYFEGKKSDKWLCKGYKILAHEINVQILNDGGHYELSPMYHAIILEDVLDLLNILRAYKPKNSNSTIKLLEDVVLKMIMWLRSMTFEDGGVSCFNDSATNISASTCNILEYAKRLGFLNVKAQTTPDLFFRHLKDSGYISTKNNKFQLILDVAKLGPDHLLAHAHADSLSFELSLGKQRVIVNSGTSCYGFSVRRAFERTTRAHNTVEINDVSSSEVWSSFRVARRAYPTGLQIKNLQNNLSIKCSHTGYHWLLGSPKHTRSWLVDNKSIIIKDEVSGKCDNAVSRLIFHCNIKIKQINDQIYVLKIPNKKELTLQVNKGLSSLVKWKHTDRFGCLSDTTCLEINLVNGMSLVEIK